MRKANNILTVVFMVIIFALLLSVIACQNNPDICRRMAKENYDHVFQIDDQTFVGLDKLGNVCMVQFSHESNKIVGEEIIIKKEWVCGDRTLEGTIE